MAAKNKRPNRFGDVRDSVGMHFRASQHRDELLEEARELQSAGRIREARAVQKRASQVDQLIGALESEVHKTPAQSDTPPTRTALGPET